MDTATAAPIAAARTSSEQSGEKRPPRAGRRSPVVIAAVGIIAAQLVIRAWVAHHSFFYWDDLILVGRAGRYPLLSTDLLLYSHDGHFMPLAFVTAWLLSAVAPLGWTAPLVTLLVGQLAVSLAVLRMLLMLLGRRWSVLFPLVFFLFSPLTLPAFAWWSAALNALPLQGALAWVIGDAVLLVRTGRRRYALSGIAVLVPALLFFEKAAIIPFVAFAVAALGRYVAGREVRPVVRRGAVLWLGSAAVLGCWLALFLSVVNVAAVHRDSDEVREMLPQAASRGVVPALFGGPWHWERWVPSTPWAEPPDWAVVTTWVALSVLVALSIRLRRRIWPVWLAAAAYVVLAQLPVALVRGGPNTAIEIMQSLRYFGDLAVTLTAAGALILRAVPRDGAARRLRATGLLGPRVAVTFLAIFLVGSLWSTYTFVRSWSVNPTKAYVANVESALAGWDGVPLLEQEVPWNVLNPLAYPQNLASQVFAPIAAPGTFADSTPRLRMITDSGAIVDAQVWWNRGIRAGPEPGCGYRIHGGEPIPLLLDGPMLEHEWTAQLNYLASRDGRIAVGFEYGRSVDVPVRAGLNTVYVRVVGSGSALRIHSRTPGLDLCIGSGPVGVASYDN